MKYFFISILLCCSLIGYSQNNDSITTEIFLDRELLEELSIDAKFINSIEYTPDKYILLASANRFYLLGIGGLIPAFDGWKGENDIESFAITSDSILVVMSGNALYQIDSDASFLKIIDIPGRDMNITSKYDNIYVYDHTLKNDKEVYSIYQISREGELTTLITISNPVLSIFEQPNQLIFSTKNRLLAVDIKTKESVEIFSLPQENDIISIVGDMINHAFYFSTANTIYRIKGNQFELITENLGGILKYDDEGLVIFNPEKQLIIKLRSNLLYSVADNDKMQTTTYAQGCNLNGDAQKHWDRAEELKKSIEEEDDYVLIATEYDNVLKYAPNCPDAYYNKAVCCEVLSKFHSENSDIAIACYKKYLELNPNIDDRNDVQAKINRIEANKEFSADEYNIKGVKAFNEVKYEQAIAYYNQAISINPNLAVAYCNLGNTYGQISLRHEENNWREMRIRSMVYYKKAIEIDPNYANAYKYLGFEYELQGKIDMALDFYEKYISLKSYDDITCYNLGIENYGYLIAVAYFKKAVGIDPLIAYSELGAWHYIDGIDVISIDPLASAYSALGKFYSERGSTDMKTLIYVNPKVYQAINCYDYATKLTSNDKKNKNFCIKMYHKIAFIYYGDLKDNYNAKIYWKMAAELGDKAAKRNLRGL